MRRLNPLHLALGLAGVVILILAFLLVREGRPQSTQERMQPGAATRTAAPEKRCASQGTYDRIKRELFRRAAVTRGGGQDMFDRLAAYAAVRVEQPLMTGIDRELGTLRCSGRLTIDLPPGTAVSGGRRSLSAEIDYVLQPAADASGDVVLLEGADPIVIPLATVARTGEQQPSVAVEQQPPLVSAPDRESETPALPPMAAPPATQAPPAVRDPAPPSTPSSAARPSFNCRYARTRSEIAICRDPGLAALDRSMASQFYRALSAADAGKRRQLTVTRDNFLRYRDRCGSDACIADAYRGRIAEISDIMARP